MRTWATALVAALLALMFASASGAAAGGPGPPLAAACHAEASAAERLTDIAADVARWRCDGTEPSLRAEQSLLRFTVPMASEARVFATRPSLFQAIELAVVRDGRVVAAGRYAAWDLPTGHHRGRRRRGDREPARAHDPRAFFRRPAPPLRSD
jgi:hypothetical protein